MFVNFFELVQGSIYWLSLYPYLKTVDSSANEFFFGIIIMTFSIGSMVSAPFFGFLTNKMQQTRLPIILGILISVIGNTIVFFVESFPNHQKWVLLTGRAVTGLGVGNTSALFAYISMASTKQEKNVVISTRAAVNALATLTGPGLAMAFVPLGYPGFAIGHFRINMYTAPALSNVILGVIEIILLSTIFTEDWVAVEEKGGEKNRALKPYDRVAAFMGVVIRTAIFFCLTSNLSLGAPFSMAMFGWSNAQMIVYDGALSFGAGIINIFGNIFVGNVVLKYAKERTLIPIGLTCLTASYVLNFPFPSEPPLIVFTTVRNVSSTCHYTWCSYTTRIYLWQYVLSYVFFPQAIALAYVPNETLFSKILGPMKQGMAHGSFAAGSAFASAVGPIASSALFQLYGPRFSIALGAGVAASSAILVVMVRKRMVPYGEYKKKEQG